MARTFVRGMGEPDPVLVVVTAAGSISDVEKKNGEASCPLGECGMSVSLLGCDPSSEGQFGAIDQSVLQGKEAWRSRVMQMLELCRGALLWRVVGGK